MSHANSAPASNKFTRLGIWSFPVENGVSIGLEIFANNGTYFFDLLLNGTATAAINRTITTTFLIPTNLAIEINYPIHKISSPPDVFGNALTLVDEDGFLQINITLINGAVTGSNHYHLITVDKSL